MKYLSAGFMASIILSSIILILVAGSGASIAYRAFEHYEGPEFHKAPPKSAEEIFLNNLQLSFWLLIPFIGLIPFLTYWWNTGWSIGFMAARYGWPNPMIALLNVLATGFWEVSAYILMMAENIYLVYCALTGNFTERVARFTWKTFLIYIVLLYFSALYEFYLIIGGR